MTIFSCLIFLPALALAGEHTAGTMFNKSNQAIKVTGFDDECRVIGNLKGQRVSLPFTELKSLQVIGPDNQYSIIKVQSRKNETSFILNESYIDHGNRRGNLLYSFINPVTGNQEGSWINVKDIKSIILRDDFGPLKYNPKTEMFFPQDYVYDPYTGEKLIWGKEE